jgi:N-acetyl-anhydromuramyl-L-alanine amidase AmpD
VRPDYIIVHCSASDEPEHDNIKAIRQLHTAPPTQAFTWGNWSTFGKGFADIGYHFFINKEGKVFDGRDLKKQGAHCKGYNKNSIGICLSGEYNFTEAQFKSLRRVVFNLQEAFRIDDDCIVGHADLNPNKTCPNFSVQEVLF